MKQLTLSLEDEISLLGKYYLTPTELLTVRVLLLLQDENNEELFKKLLSTLKDLKIQFRDILVELQKKEIILKSYSIPKQGETFNPFIIPINKNFIKNLYKGSFEMGKELFEVYPQWTVINQNMVSLRGVSKHFDSLEDCYYKYGKSIGWNLERHSKILDLVSWGKETGVLCKSLGAFVVDNGWHDLESLKDGDGLNVNFEAIKMV